MQQIHAPTKSKLKRWRIPATETSSSEDKVKTVKIGYKGICTAVDRKASGYTSNKAGASTNTDTAEC